MNSTITLTIEKGTPEYTTAMSTLTRGQSNGNAVQFYAFDLPSLIAYRKARIETYSKTTVELLAA